MFDIFNNTIAIMTMMMVDISVNMFLETHIYLHLNKNKVNTKIVTLRPALLDMHLTDMYLLFI